VPRNRYTIVILGGCHYSSSSPITARSTPGEAQFGIVDVGRLGRAYRLARESTPIPSASLLNSRLSPCRLESVKPTRFERGIGLRATLPRHPHNSLTNTRANMASGRATRTMYAMDSLPSWARWIIVFAAGLSPILTYFIAGVVGRFLRRRLRPRPQGSSLVAHKPGATPKEEADSGPHRPSI
jgi:hypothetical protein